MLEVRVLDPLSLPSFASRDVALSLVGAAGFASQLEAEGGTAVDRVMSPLRVDNVFAAFTAATTTTVNADDLAEFLVAIARAKPRAVTTIKVAAGTYASATRVRVPAWADLVIQPDDGLGFGDVVVEMIFDYGHGTRVEWKKIDFRHAAVATNMHTGFLSSVTFNDCDCLAAAGTTGKFWFANNVCAVVFKADTRTCTYDYSMSQLSLYIIDHRYGGYFAAEYISSNTRKVIFKAATDQTGSPPVNAPSNGPIVYLVSQVFYTDNMELIGGTTGGGAGKTSIGLLLNRGTSGVFNGAGPGCMISNCSTGINSTRGSKCHVGGTVTFDGTTTDMSAEPGAEVSWDVDTVVRSGALNQDNVDEGLSLRSFSYPSMAIYGARITNATGGNNFSGTGWNANAPTKAAWLQMIGTGTSLTGLAGGYDCRLALIEQSALVAHSFLLANESALSTASNRFSNERGHTLLLPGDKIELIFNARSNGSTAIATPTAWATATAYVIDNVVTFGVFHYICLVNHTSGVFATDLAAVKWLKLGRWLRKSFTSLARQNWRRFAILPGTGTAPQGDGLGVTAQGTISHPALATGSYIAGMRRMRAATGASAAAEASIRGDQLSFYLGDAAGRGGFAVRFVFGFGLLPSTAMSCFIGMRGSVANPGDVNASGLFNLIGVYSDPTQTTVRTINAAAGTSTVADIGATAPLNTTAVYEMWITCAPNALGGTAEFTRAIWRLDDATVAPLSARVTATIPATTLFMTPTAWICNRAASADYAIDVMAMEVFTPS